MDRAEALRSIRYDLVEYIQKRVRVNFDNARQAPVSFAFAGKTHAVGEVLGRFRTQKGHSPNAFLVHVKSDDVYFLYFHLCDMNQNRALREVYWVLSFRILSDHELMALYREERKMLLNMTFKRVVDFHGHLCPDLVLGGKLCEYVQQLLSSNGNFAAGISIIAENTTSALDAIQILLGTTIGNQRMTVIDFGKHSYTLLSNNIKTGFRFSLRPQHYGDENLYNSLEQKIRNHLVMLEEVVQFQKLLDERAQKLLALSPEELFEVECVEKGQQPVETASVYLICDKCGHQVLKSRSVDVENRTFCIPCFQRINKGCRYYSLQ